MTGSDRSPTLRELQLWLKGVLTDPRGASGALDDGSGSHAPRASIATTGSHSLAERLDVYAEGYFARLHEALAEDFRATRRLLGEAPFRAVVIDYLRAHPSRTANLGEVGWALPGFIADHPYGRRIAAAPPLAELERLVIESFYAPVTQTSESSNDAWETLVVKLDASVRLLDAHHTIEAAWASRDAEAMRLPIEIDAPDPGALLVYRNAAGSVDVARVDHREAAIFRGMLAQRPLAAVLADLGTAAETIPFAEWFARWGTLGLIRGYL